MNKLSLLLSTVLIVICLLTSCGKDEDKIVGTWSYFETTADVETNNDEATKAIMDTISHKGSEGKGLIVEFRKNGKIYSDKIEIGSYNASDDKLTLDYYVGGSHTTTYSISGKILTIYRDDKSVYDASMLHELGFEDPSSIVVKKVISHINYTKIN